MGKNISSKNQHHARLDRNSKIPHGCISLGCALDTISLAKKTKKLVILQLVKPFFQMTANGFISHLLLKEKLQNQMKYDRRMVVILEWLKLGMGGGKVKDKS